MHVIACVYDYLVPVATLSKPHTSQKVFLRTCTYVDHSVTIHSCFINRENYVKS